MFQCPPIVQDSRQTIKKKVTKVVEVPQTREVRVMVQVPKTIVTHEQKQVLHAQRNRRHLLASPGIMVPAPVVPTAPHIGAVARRMYVHICTSSSSHPYRPMQVPVVKYVEEPTVKNVTENYTVPRTKIVVQKKEVHLHHPALCSVPVWPLFFEMVGQRFLVTYQDSLAPRCG